MPRAVRSLRGLILLGLLSAPAGGAAQARPTSPRGGASAEALIGVRGTSLRGEATLMVGGSARLRVHPDVAFGGSAWVLTEVLNIDGERTGGGLGLRVGYGGGGIWLTLRRSARMRVDAGLLLGAGNAKIELPAVGTEIAADNFFVFEPEVGLAVRMTGWAAARVSVGYRAVTGVEDLPGVGARQLRGSAATIGLVFGPQ